MRNLAIAAAVAVVVIGGEYLHLRSEYGDQLKPTAVPGVYTTPACKAPAATTVGNTANN